MTRQFKSYACALTAVLLWSTVATAFKLSLGYLDPVQLLLYASTTSACVLFVILAVQRKLALYCRYRLHDYGRCLALGLFNPVVYYLILFKAYQLLPAQEAQPINYTWVIMLAVLSIPLLKQKLTWLQGGAILIGYFGVLIIATQGDPLSLRFSNSAGVLLALASTVIWALYWIVNTRSSKDPVAELFLQFLFGLPWIVLIAARYSTIVVVPAQRAGIIGAIYVGIFEMGLTFVLWLSALRLSDSAAKISTLVFFAPFISLLFIHFILGEQIRTSSVVGLACIISGNFLMLGNLRSTRRPTRTAL